MTVKLSAPLYVCATPVAAKTFGSRLQVVAEAAFLEIGRAARGFEIHHHQFRLPTGEWVAVASRVRASGVPEIEIDLGHAGLPAHTFTRAEAEAARKAAPMARARPRR